MLKYGVIMFQFLLGKVLVSVECGVVGLSLKSQHLPLTYQLLISDLYLLSCKIDFYFGYTSFWRKALFGGFNSRWARFWLVWSVECGVWSVELLGYL
jgi:hypothetical protein